MINDDSIPKLRCRIVAGAANNQLKEDRHGQELHDRGILYAPDYVINAGGLINVYNELIGYNREVAMRMARGIFGNMARLFEIARAQSIPTYLAADRLAEERIARMKGLGRQHWVRMVRARRSPESGRDPMKVRSAPRRLSWRSPWGRSRPPRPRRRSATARRP